MAIDKSSVNKVLLVGRLGNDPESTTLQSGSVLVRMSIATTRSWRDRTSNETKELTEWHRIVMFGRMAEVALQYLHKGSLVYVEGHLRTSSYEKDGIKRYNTEIMADNMTMLGAKNSAGGAGAGAGAGADAGGYGAPNTLNAPNTPNTPNTSTASANAANNDKKPDYGDAAAGGSNDFDEDIPF